MKVKFILLVLCIALIGVLGLDQNIKVEASLTDQKKQSEANIENFKNEIKKLDGQIFEILAKINEVEAGIANNEATINQLQTDLVQKQNELITATQKYDAEKQEYYSHLRNKYEDGEIDYTEIILDSANITDFINYNEYYRIVKEQEEKQVQSIKDSKSAIEAQKASIEENKKNTEAELNSLAVEKQKLDSIKHTYDSTKAQMESQLAAEEAARASIIQQLNDLMNQYNPSAPNYGGNYTGNGSLQWPVPSVSPSTSNVQRFSSYHKGFDIGGMTDTNRAIVAADSGVVILAQSYYGYGNTVMINHGNGMVTLYGHLNSINVSPGQGVSRGEQIGIMGDTGQSFGIHLHFEVIINGTYVDPEPYIR